MSARAAAAAELEARIGHVFADRALFERALTHSSVGQGARRVSDNERLEFLGDRVLGLLAAEALIQRWPEAREGELTPRLHALVDRRACAAAARRMGLAPALRLSPGEARSGGRENDTILGDACEALMAALFIDAGLDAARRVFRDVWAEPLAEGAGSVGDPKSTLQRWALARSRGLPAYRVVERTGPDHAPTFTVEAAVEGVEPAVAAGRSRMEAEKAAALAILQREAAL